MATPRQIAANRRNAQHCTGPTSPAGRAISSMNALKTGIDAKSGILPDENPAERAALATEYYARFTPATPEEHRLVDALIRDEWLTRRYRRVEATIWENQLGAMETPCLGAAFIAASAALCRVGRRQNAAHRDFLAALKQLFVVRAETGAKPGPIAVAAPVSAAHNKENKPRNNELDSFRIFAQSASLPTLLPPESHRPVAASAPGGPPLPIPNPPPVLDSTFGP